VLVFVTVTVDVSDWVVVAVAVIVVVLVAVPDPQVPPFLMILRQTTSSSLTRESVSSPQPVKLAPRAAARVSDINNL